MAVKMTFVYMTTTTMTVRYSSIVMIVHAEFKGIKTSLNYLTLACAQIMLKMTFFKSQIRFLYFFFPRQKSKPANIINVATVISLSKVFFICLYQG